MFEIYIYWISTTLLSLLYVTSAYMYATKGDWIRQALADLGYPAYLVPVMIVVKVLGVAAGTQRSRLCRHFLSSASVGLGPYRRPQAFGCSAGDRGACFADRFFCHAERRSGNPVTLCAGDDVLTRHTTNTLWNGDEDG